MRLATYHALIQVAASLGLFLGGLGTPLGVAYFVYGPYVLALPITMLLLPLLCARLAASDRGKLRASWAGWVVQWGLLGLAVVLQVAHLNTG